MTYNVFGGTLSLAQSINQYWLSHNYLSVLFFCSVFSIIRYVISVSNYRRPAWMAKAFWQPSTLDLSHMYWLVYVLWKIKSSSLLWHLARQGH